MTTFQDRERSFEAKFAHDEEVRFLAAARRDKLFARWAADRLGLSDQARSALTDSVLAIRDGVGHDASLLQEVGRLFAESGAKLAPDELVAALTDCATRAEQQLPNSPPPV